MKKLLVILVFIMAAMTLTAYAATNEQMPAAEQYEIIFENEATLSDAEKDRIVDIVNRYLLTGETANTPETSQTRGLLCLFGHDNTSESIYLVHHRVRDTNPRCEKQHYVVTMCSRCDYSTYEYITKRYISCCPEE